MFVTLFKKFRRDSIPRNVAHLFIACKKYCKSIHYDSFAERKQQALNGCIINFSSEQVAIIERELNSCLQSFPWLFRILRYLKLSRSCANCLRQDQKLKRCAGSCNSNTFYCSHKCQKIHWLKHRLECHKL